MLEQRHGAIAVLHIGRVDEQLERAPVGIHHGMALAPHHLLANLRAAGLEIHFCGVAMKGNRVARDAYSSIQVGAGALAMLATLQLREIAMTLD